VLRIDWLDSTTNATTTMPNIASKAKIKRSKMPRRDFFDFMEFILVYSPPRALSIGGKFPYKGSDAHVSRKDAKAQRNDESSAAM
jgi:hypothetical protein